MIDYNEVIETLVQLGCNEKEVRSGSIPEVHLRFVLDIIGPYIGDEPMLTLHIGNFVGVSLVHVTEFLLHHNPKNIVVSIDPNIPHRGIHHCLELSSFLLRKYDLHKNSVILTGYSNELPFYIDGCDQRIHYRCENLLENLKVLTGQARFKLALIDGCHKDTYLKQELLIVDTLLMPGGILLVDDIDDHWPKLRRVFAEIDRSKYVEVGNLKQSRVGILQKQ